MLAYYWCGHGNLHTEQSKLPILQRILILSTHDKYLANELLSNVTGIVSSASKRVYGFPVTFSAIAECDENPSCVTFIELPLIRSNDDVMDISLRLRKRCFNETLFYIEGQKWDETLASEDFKLLLAFLKLNAIDILKSFKILVSLESDSFLEKTKIVNDLEEVFKEFYTSGFGDNQVSTAKIRIKWHGYYISPM